MRYEKLVDLLRLAIAMSGTAEGLSLDEIAARDGVNRRTAERMLRSLRETFPQIESVPGDGRSLRWRLPQSAIRHLITVDVAELMELDNAARRLRDESAADGRAQALETLASKVRSALKPELRRRTETDTAALMEAEGTAVRPGPRPQVAEPILKGIRDALLKLHRLSMVYATTAVPSGSERIVEPLGVLHGLRPYLVAQIVGRPFSPTVFRLDRILDLHVLPEAFTRPASFSLQEYAARSFGVWQEPPIDVTLRFSGAAAQEALNFHLHPSQVVEPQDDGTLLIRFKAGGRLEMMQHLVTWGQQVEIIEPASLRDEMASWCLGLSQHHQMVQPQVNLRRKL
jgi:predicted DNA-binding transcriptional regulator YafY